MASKMILKGLLVRILRNERCPLSLDAFPGYYGNNEQALAELVAQGVIIPGPPIPHRTWTLPEYKDNPPKRTATVKKRWRVP